MSKLAVRHRTIRVNGCKVFYREAGNDRKKQILLLNGFSNSSSVFQDLMDDLKRDYYLIAPDFPRFGRRDGLSRERFDYSFEDISNIIEEFMTMTGLSRPSVYALGDGGAVSFRIAMRKPGVFDAFILQNTNACMEGFETAICRQHWLQETQPKMLLIWGKNSVIFSIATAEGLKDNVPGTKLYVYDTSHMVLEEHHRAVAGNIRYFLG